MEIDLRIGEFEYQGIIPPGEEEPWEEEIEERSNMTKKIRINHVRRK